MKLQLINSDPVSEARLKQIIAAYMPEVEVIDEVEKTDKQAEMPRRQRYIVRLGDKIHIIWMDDVAYFVSHEKTTYLITREGKQYILDISLDNLENQLEPDRFFRINRAMIVEIHSVMLATRHFSGRLKLQLNPNIEEDVFVSRVKTGDFMQWINC